MTYNLKSLKREYWEQPNSREPKYFISIGRSSTKRQNTAEVYRFSKGVVTKYNISDYTHCKLGFNKSFQVIYFKFLKENDLHKIPPGYLKITKDRNVRKIAGVGFARKYQINDDQYAGRYSCHEINIGKTDLELAIILPEKNQVQ